MENAENVETKTTIDSLIDLLKSKGKMDLNSVSLTLGIDPKVVEAWAKVLESGGILKVSYEIGKMYLEIMPMGREDLGAVEKKLEEQKNVLSSDLSSQSATLEGFSNELKNINVNLDSLEMLYKTSLPGVEALLSQINKFNEIADSSNKRLDAIIKKAEETNSSISKRIEALSNRLDSISSTGFDRAIAESNTKISNILKAAEEAREAIRSIETSTSESFKILSKNIAIQAETLKKQASEKGQNVVNQLKTSNLELESIIKAMQERSAEVKAAGSELKEFRAQRAGALRMLNMEKSEFNDMYQKVYNTLNSSKVQIDATSKQLIAKINELKNSFGEVSMIDSKLRDLKSQFDDIKNQVEGAKRDVAELSNQLKALERLPKNSFAEKSSRLKNISEGSKKSKGKIKKIKEDIDDMSKKFK
ncbi:MAG: hypothetical protein ACP5TL_00170 [Candidatus Micrarchaeia archaeon]